MKAELDVLALITELRDLNGKLAMAEARAVLAEKKLHEATSWEGPKSPTELDGHRATTLAMVGEAWKTMPTLRLGQLIYFLGNSVKQQTDVFYIEDTDLVEASLEVLEEDLALTKNLQQKPS